MEGEPTDDDPLAGESARDMLAALAAAPPMALDRWDFGGLSPGTVVGDGLRQLHARGIGRSGKNRITACYHNHHTRKRHLAVPVNNCSAYYLCNLLGMNNRSEKIKQVNQFVLPIH